MKIKIAWKEPRIIVTTLAYNKMQHYVKMSSDEIGWLGDVEINDFTFTIRDVFLLKQQVGMTTCELDSNAILDLYEQRLDAGIPTETIMLWGHSHVNMGVSPSEQDETQFSELGKNSTYFIRLIMNKAGNYSLCLADNKKGIVYEDMDWELAMDDISDEIKKEIDNNVTKIVYTYPKYSNRKGRTNKNVVNDNLIDFTYGYGDYLNREM